MFGGLDEPERNRLYGLLAKLNGTSTPSKGRHDESRRICLREYAAEHFRWSFEDGVATITLNRPERKNPLTFESYAELRDLFRRAASTLATCDAIVLTGAGDNFCSGGDVHEIIGPLTTMAMPELLAFTRMTGDLVKAMRACPQPIVAAVDGVCAGAGAMLALASDLRFGTREARVAFLFIRVGLAGADMGACSLLPRVIGHGRASELLFTGRAIGADEALAWGFFNRLVQPAALLDDAHAFARSLAAGPTFAHAMTKKMLHHEWSMGLDEAIEAEAEAQAICMQTRDFRRAYEAFAAKRAPGLRGRLMQRRHVPVAGRSSTTTIARWRRRSTVWSRRARRRPTNTTTSRRVPRTRPLRSAATAGCATRCRPRSAARSTRSIRARSASCARRSPGTTRWPISRSRCRDSAARRSSWPAPPRVQERYLPRVCSGDAIAAFALSEADAGSDVAALSTTARRSATATSTCSTARRAWISNGGIADFYVVFARTGEGAGQPRAERVRRRRGRAGLTVAERIDAHRTASAGDAALDGCRVRRGPWLGAARRRLHAGDAARSTSFARASPRRRSAWHGARSTKRSNARRRARCSAGSWPTFSSRKPRSPRWRPGSTRARCSRIAPRGCVTSEHEPATREAAMAKLTATETAQRTIDRAVQLFGALGVHAAESIAERLYREIRALRIYEGATEVQQLIVARADARRASRSRRARKRMMPTHARTSTRSRATTYRRETSGRSFSSRCPSCSIPPRLNCAVELLDTTVAHGHGDAAGDRHAGAHAARTRELLGGGEPHRARAARRSRPRSRQPRARCAASTTT